MIAVAGVAFETIAIAWNGLPSCWVTAWSVASLASVA